MDFFEVVNRRFSARKYLQKSMDKHLLDTILETVTKAPSAGNLKAYKILALNNKEIKSELAKAAFNQNFIFEAPVVLVFCALPEISSAVYGKRGAELYSIQDATIAASYAQLAATAVGLATCWVGAFDEDLVKKILGLVNERPIVLMPIGFAAENKISKKNYIKNK
ncbi:MAG: nitroreductase family protein [Candidatus Diapherotrites archaeon]|nr:nitroreductase family protein [Candidatus Diapherotrites archaeon]